MALFDKESDIKKAIKGGESKLEKVVFEKYPTLSQKDIKNIVIEKKWMDELEKRVLGEVDRISHRLADRVRELAERYATPLPQLTHEVEELSAKVDGHLKQMGFAVKS
jgi:type I restriction enzyme M protein